MFSEFLLLKTSTEKQAPGVSKIFASIYDWVNTCEISQLDAILVALFFFGGGCGLILLCFVSSWFGHNKPEQQLGAFPVQQQQAAVNRATVKTSSGAVSFGQPASISSLRYSYTQTAVSADNQRPNPYYCAEAADPSKFGAPRRAESTPWAFGQAAAASRAGR